jgi:hypothetical protein
VIGASASPTGAAVSIPGSGAAAGEERTPVVGEVRSVAVVAASVTGAGMSVVDADASEPDESELIAGARTSAVRVGAAAGAVTDGATSVVLLVDGS